MVRPSPRSCSTVFCVAAGLVAAAPCLAGSPWLEASRIHTESADFRTIGWLVTAIGDFDGDGVEDYAASNRYADGNCPDGVYVYSGASGGFIFGEMGQQDDRYGVTVAGAGDTNNDGHQELIVGAPLYLQDGNIVGRAHLYTYHNGCSQLLHTFTGTGTQGLGRSVAGIGDVNGDGHDDLAIGAVIDNTFGSVIVYSGATYAPLYTISGNATIYQLGASLAALGDVNGDGYGDMAIGAPQSGHVVIASGQNGAVLRTLAGAPGTQFGVVVARAGDITGDGASEVIIGAPDGNKAFVYNAATGALIRLFQHPGKYGTTVSGGYDVNADGVPDVAIGAPWASTPTSFGRVEIRSGADGTLIRALKGAAEDVQFAVSVAMVEDINQNGFGDVLVGAPLPQVVDPCAPAVTVVFAYTEFKCAFSFEQQLATGLEITGMVAARLNEDELPDLVLLNGPDKRMTILLQNACGQFEPGPSYGVGGTPSEAAAADFDGDGDIDLAFALASANKLSFFRNNGQGAFSKSGKLKTGNTPIAMIARDFSSDGRPDFAVANRDSNQVWFYRNSAVNPSKLSKRFFTPKKYKVPNGPTRLGSGRFNVDAAPDLVVLCSDANQITALLNNGIAVFGTKTNTTVEPGTFEFAVGDFNCDTRADVAYLTSGMDLTCVRLGGFNGMLGQPSPYLVNPGPRLVCTPDLNDDGHPDVLTANETSGTLTVLLSNHWGGLIFGTHLTMPMAGPHAVTCTDLDGDGDNDIVIAHQATGTVTVLENQWY